MRKYICLLFCLCLLLTACGSEVPPAPTTPTSAATQPTAPATEPVTEPVSETGCYRLVPDEASETLGLSEDTWFVLYDDGTGVGNFRGETEYLCWDDSRIWYSAQVLPYTKDGSNLLCSNSGFELTFAPSADLPDTTVEGQFPPNLQLLLDASFWLGWCDLQLAADTDHVGSPILMEFFPDDSGRVMTTIHFATRNGTDSNVTCFTTYNEFLDGLLLLGNYNGAPVLADSNCYLMENNLYLTLSVGDPTAGDSYTVNAQLQLLGSYWEGEDGQLVMPPDQVLHYQCMSSEEVLLDFRTEGGYTLDLYKNYLDYGWSLPFADDLTGSWTVLTFSAYDGQPAYYFLDLFEDGTATLQWLYLEDSATREVYTGTWRTYMENRAFLELDLQQENGESIHNTYPVLFTPDPDMLFMGTGFNGDSTALIKPEAETMLTIWERSVG